MNVSADMLHAEVQKSLADHRQIRPRGSIRNEGSAPTPEVLSVGEYLTVIDNDLQVLQETVRELGSQLATVLRDEEADEAKIRVPNPFPIRTSPLALRLFDADNFVQDITRDINEIKRRLTL